MTRPSKQSKARRNKSARAKVTSKKKKVKNEDSNALSPTRSSKAGVKHALSARPLVWRVYDLKYLAMAMLAAFSIRSITEGIYSLVGDNISDHTLHGVILGFWRFPYIHLLTSIYLLVNVIRYLGAAFSTELLLESNSNTTDLAERKGCSRRFVIGLFDFLCNVGVMTMLLMAAYSVKTHNLIEFSIWMLLAVGFDALFCFGQFSIASVGGSAQSGIRADMISDYQRWLFHWMLIDALEFLTWIEIIYFEHHGGNVRCQLGCFTVLFAIMFLDVFTNFDFWSLLATGAPWRLRPKESSNGS